MYLPLNHTTVQLTHLPQNIVAPYQTSRVVIGVENIDVRYLDDGTVPTSTTGLLLANGKNFDNPVDLESFDVISVTSANGANADATISGNATNSDVTFTADEIGVAFNDIEFSLVTSAVNEANATATLNSSNVNSDLVVTAPDVGDVYNGVNFELITDATNAANATLELVVNAAANIIWTANAVGDEWNDYVFQMAAADPGTKSQAILDSTAVNSDLTLSAPSVGTASDDTVFTTEAATDGNEANATIDSTAGNSDLTFTATIKGVLYNDIDITLATDATVGANATATLTGSNATLTFTAPELGTAYNGTVFQTADGAAAVAYNATNDTFTISVNATTTFDDVDELFDTLDPNYPQWTCVDGANVMEIVANNLTDTSANGLDLQDDEVDYAANAYTVHLNVNATANDAKILWDEAQAANPAWPQLTCAVEGDGTGIVDDAANATTANGVDPTIAVNYSAPTFTISVWEDNSTAAQVKVVFDAEVANNVGWPQWTSAIEGNGAGIVDISLNVNSAGGVNAAAASVDLDANTNTFTISVAVDTTATEVAALTYADWTATVNGTGSTIVANDAGPENTAGGVTAIDPYMTFVENEATIHVYVGATGSDAKTLFDSEMTANPTWQQWTIAVEGDGSGLVTTGVNTTSTGGLDQVNAAVTFDAANDVYTISVYADSIGSGVVTLWAAAMAAHPTWPQFTAAEEGDGTGVVNTADATSANGVDGTGALLQIIYYKDSE